MGEKQEKLAFERGTKMRSLTLDVTAQATAITSTFDRSSISQQLAQQPMSPSGGQSTTVATGALLDLGEDIPTPPDQQQRGQGRDPSQSANVEEQTEGQDSFDYVEKL